MTVSLPTLVALLALTIAVFAVLTAGGIYARLRHVERVMLDHAWSAKSLQDKPMPEQLRPRPGELGTIVLVLTTQCPSCDELWHAAVAATHAGELARLRVAAVFAEASAAVGYEDGMLETHTDADTWKAVYEGYAPAVGVLDSAGKVLDRRFIHADIDLRRLLGELANGFSARAGSGALIPTS